MFGDLPQAIANYYFCLALGGCGCGGRKATKHIEDTSLSHLSLEEVLFQQRQSNFGGHC